MPTKIWEPLPASARFQTLDLLRGFALFGVLTVNLLSFFRISLFDDILHLHASPGALNEAIETFRRGVLEFKAFEMFSLTFGMGVAVQTERAFSRGVVPELFLLRRFAFLLLAGLAHLVLISNVDILTLYAFCGFVLILFLRVPAAILTAIGIAAIYLPSLFPIQSLPSGEVLRNHAAEATRVYSSTGFLPLAMYRWAETRQFVAPLLEGVAQRSLGLMMIGMAVWRAGLVRNPARFRSWLWVFFAVAGSIGAINTAAELYGFTVPAHLSLAGSNFPLALAYAAGLIAWTRSGRASRLLAPVAAAGQMALTSYLTQTILFSIVFYGYGLGLMGRLSSWQAALGGVVLYAAQLWFSMWWLARYRFGPFEWLWRSATYGRRQQFAIAG